MSQQPLVDLIPDLPLIQAIESNFTDHETRIAEYGIRLAAQDSSLADYETRIAVLESEAADRGPRLAALESGHADHEARIAALESNTYEAFDNAGTGLSSTTKSGAIAELKVLIDHINATLT